MSNRAEWKLRIAEEKNKTAKLIKQDYLAGLTVDKIHTKYHITARTFYKWIVISPEEKIEHKKNLKQKKLLIKNKK
jgi:DNA invertase Pin-like site-specific DNA recombinase